MPTNFTVVPVDDTGKAKKGSEDDDVDDNNVLKEEEEGATGEIRCLLMCLLCQVGDKSIMLINRSVC